MQHSGPDWNVSPGNSGYAHFVDSPGFFSALICTDEIVFEASHVSSRSAHLGAFGKEFSAYMQFRVARGRFDVMGSTIDGLTPLPERE